MDDLKFNVTAMVNPTTPEEYQALLDECVLELEYLSASLDNWCAEIEKLESRDE